MTRGSAERRGVNFDEFAKEASKRYPMRRVGVPEDVANVVAFLVSNESSYVAGEVVHVGGGDR